MKISTSGSTNSGPKSLEKMNDEVPPGIVRGAVLMKMYMAK